MGMKPVVEPAGNDKYPNAKSVERAEGADTLFFPHVDSCLAIVFILEDDAVVGAHVGQFGGKNFGDHQPNENARAAVVEMKTLTGGKRILDVFTLGDSGYFNRSTFLADVTKKPVIVDARTSVDITVDPKLRVITAVLCSDSSKKTEWKFSELHTGKTSI